MTDELRTDRSSVSWVLALLMLVMLGIAVWFMWPGEGGDPTPTAEQAEALEEMEEGGATEPNLPVEPLPLAEIEGAPYEWSGRLVQGTAQIAEIAGEHGFWIGGGDARMFVLVDTQGGPAPELEEGVTVEITAARVRVINGAGGRELPPAEVLEILRGEEVYLAATGPAILVSAG